jgi:tRNA(Ile)-lysidine synthase
MFEKILKFFNESDIFANEGLVLICVSGGADSMALLEVMREISPEFGFNVAAVHFNHNLRGEESDRDEQFVKDYCASHEIPCYFGSADVKEYALAQGLGIEEAARDLRYMFFSEVAAEIGAKFIATGHNADDNTETMILNLARGTGTAGFGGIPPIRDNIVRPMLSVSRDEVEVFVNERGIPYIEDSTNKLDCHTRNKIRHSVIPVLKEINPRLNEATFTAAEISRADEKYLSEQAEIFISENCEETRANAAAILDLPTAISGRVIRKLCKEKSLSSKHVKAVLNLCKAMDPSARLSLPGLTVFREYEDIVFEQNSQRLEEDDFQPIYPLFGEIYKINGTGLNFSCKSIVNDGTINKSATKFVFKLSDIYGKIVVRSRREGDAVRILGRNGTKTLKKLFIEQRVPERKRALIPIIADDVGVLAIYGIGVSDRAVPLQGDKAILIEFFER